MTAPSDFNFNLMAKPQDTIETYYIAAVFLDGDFSTEIVIGRNLTAEQAALDGVLKINGYDNGEKALKVERDTGVREVGGWRRFIVTIDDDQYIPVAVVHVNTRPA